MNRCTFRGSNSAIFNFTSISVGSALEGKNLASRGATFLEHVERTLGGKKGKNEKGRVASHESVSVHLDIL